MKKLLALLLCLMMGIAPAMAEELTVVQETYTPVELYEGIHYAYMFAEVINNGEEPVAFDEGEWDLLDAAGEEVTEFDVYECFPAILAPGESGWVMCWNSLDELTAADVPGYALDIEVDEADDPVPARLTASATVAEVTEWDETVCEVMITVTNQTDEMVFDAQVAFALYDAAGKLIFVNADTLYGVGIPAGGTIAVRQTVDGGLIPLWQAANTMPATASAIVYAEE